MKNNSWLSLVVVVLFVSSFLVFLLPSCNSSDQDTADSGDSVSSLE